MPSVVQVPWLTIEEPSNDEVVTLEAEEKRLWLISKGRDPSGSVRLGCPHRVALRLAQVENQEDFERKKSEDALGYPLFVHARISRTVKASSSQTGGKDFVGHTLEEVLPVSWTKSEAPNASFASLLTVLNNLPPHDECIQFAFLKDLQEDPHYGFRIVYDGKPGPMATYAAVLVESVRATTTTSCGDGFKAETKDIRDVAHLSLATATEVDVVHQEPSYTIVGFSGLNGIVKLDPPRGKKSRFAVILLDKFESGVIEMQKAEYVEQEDAEGAVACFQRLRQLCKLIHPVAGTKRTHAESERFVQSPVCMKKCRNLRSMPTDTSLFGDP